MLQSLHREQRLRQRELELSQSRWYSSEAALEASRRLEMRSWQAEEQAVIRACAAEVIKSRRELLKERREEARAQRAERHAMFYPLQKQLAAIVSAHEFERRLERRAKQVGVRPRTPQRPATASRVVRPVHPGPPEMSVRGWGVHSAGMRPSTAPEFSVVGSRGGTPKVETARAGGMGRPPRAAAGRLARLTPDHREDMWTFCRP